LFRPYLLGLVLAGHAKMYHDAAEFPARLPLTLANRWRAHLRHCGAVRRRRNRSGFSLLSRDCTTALFVEAGTTPWQDA
jgi:hypothetical protein